MPHIISVDNMKIFRHFLNDGYVGVRLPLKYYKYLKEGGISGKRIDYLLATIYDIFADLKRVKEGDEIFIHVKGEQKIFGVFRATSVFLENPTIPEIFRSYNLLKESLSGCQLPPLDQDDFLWQVSIKSDEELYFSEGFDANEIFRIKELTRKIWTIPCRWKYEDKEKTVRPLLPEEGRELIKLLQKFCPHTSSKASIVPKNLRGFRKIELPLTSVDKYVRDEKLIEAWMMANAIKPESIKAHENIKAVFGDFSFIANTIRSFYIKFMDVFGYSIKNNERTYKIVEIKARKASPKDLVQLINYVKWIAEFLCNNTLNKVRAF